MKITLKNNTMIQVKFYSIDIYDLGVRHESELAGKLYCSVSLIRDLADETTVSETDSSLQ